MSSEFLVLPAVPLAETVVFPRTIASAVLYRQRALAALEVISETPTKRAFFSLIDPSAGEGAEDNFHDHGTVGEVLQVSRGSEGAAKVIVEGLYEARVIRRKTEGEWTEVTIERVDPALESGPELTSLVRSVLNQFRAGADLDEKVPEGLSDSLAAIDDPLALSYQAGNNAPIGPKEKQAILEEPSVAEKLQRLVACLKAEVEVKELEEKILEQVRSRISRSQRDYFLNEQLKVIEKELGVDDEDEEIRELMRTVQACPMSEEAKAKAEREVRRLDKMPSISPEATVSRTYIETLLELPWGKYTEDNLDITHAQSVLDQDHHALDRAKERIVEFIAVLRNVKEIRGPILCLVGPPGVGKTSLARSIARALGRQFVRVALGGVRDEAEIRGHRRTYIGSMPGKVLQSMRKAGSMNPVFLFDEVDKMTSDFRGDPASALLEVLDPEQNKAFNDHYLEVDFDLSRVLFITTANYAGAIPPPLLDRMEVLRLPGYTEEEKLGIAREFLLPRQCAEHGLAARDIGLPDRAIRQMITQYTREAGVRNLERDIARICRKVVRLRMQNGTRRKMAVNSARIRELLGPPAYKDVLPERRPNVGIVTALAWTEFGGELLPVEALVMPGQGKLTLTLTGKLGEVMQESARAALAYIRTHFRRLGVPENNFMERDLHVHIPEGAIPKDGPSAGVAMLTSMVSALSGRPVRQDVGMTGEITLRGGVLRIGGLKEKVLAAHRHGMRTIILPVDNMDDLDELPQSARDVMKFIPVKSVDEVLRVMLDTGDGARRAATAGAARRTTATSATTRRDRAGKRGGGKRPTPARRGPKSPTRRAPATP